MSKSLFVVAVATLVVSAPLLAHGWPPPVGQGIPGYSGPAGAQSGANADAGAVGAGGTGTGTGTVGGSTTGTTSNGGTVGVGGTGSGGNSDGAPKTRYGGGAGGSSRVGSSGPAKAKGGSTPWLGKIHIPWMPAYLPAIPTEGYGARVGTIADAIKLSPAQGGWLRDTRPVIVFAYDATNADHRRLLTTLDADGRVNAAAHFFNCFRVDVGAFSDKSAAKDAVLSVFTADGTLIGEVSGQRKLSAVYDLLESAWAKQYNTPITNRVAKMDGFLKSKAYVEHFIPLCEAGIVCPDCGHERLDIIERIAELKARGDACDRAMEELRTVAKN